MLEPGFVVIHSNKLETLRELLVQWLAKHPVSVLGTEEILVQSNGIAQWLKWHWPKPPTIIPALLPACR